MGNDDSEGAIESPQPTKEASASRPGSFLIHGFFNKQSTRVGMVATKAYFKVIEFLVRDITLPAPIQFLPHKKPVPPDHHTERSEKLKAEIRRSHEVLASARTVFPLTPFPDDVTVDRAKVTIHRRGFFFSSDMLSIRIEDILNVGCGVGPLFGSITIVSRVLTTEDRFTINFFWRKDAIRLKHVLQGYVIALHNRIDYEHLEKDDLIAVLEDLGHDSNG